ncbi:MAG: 2-keto-4-pentenoate hydratase [Bacillota bacterium]|jgi:2-keto-4-pentenoate hydratase
MLDRDMSHQLANRLLTAERAREPIAPITEEIEDFNTEDAYQVQSHIINTKITRNNCIAGKKIGLTSLAAQNQFGVYEPIYGSLLSNMEVADGGIIRLEELLLPKVEPEIAFILGKDLTGPGVSVCDVLRATEAVVPALEIADSRIKDWRIKVPDAVADNSSSARFILGGQLTHAADLDLRLTGLVFKKNGEILGTAAGAAVLGHPAAAVAWLVNKLAELELSLKAGEVVLAGALTASVAPKAGDYFEACFDRLDSASVRFA